ncbi:MAG: sigma 54-dependent Fis family transcriptional regulator [Labilithrix sp.]|nr:sigma 54-dependent Fis family transcriptional regulator [Labilithrix sp.]MCW5814623.1 sigma 54-dependent Fis family transcriptional regulator [Labilithrix sp.]
MSEFVLDETAKVPGARGVAVLAVELVVIEGPSRGVRCRVENGTAKVGSAEGSSLRLADRAVSRVHLEVVASATSVTLRDLGSTNGTFIGETRVRDVDVAPGTVVRCGASAFRVDAASEPTFLAISARTSFGELVGASLPMRQVYTVLERVAASDTTLLVQGETGTGKDVVARSVHAQSPRARGPFVPVDCGAIPETLFESELFGHVRGAFTGAVQNRAGAFEEASGGTLFLDEIGEMPLAMQAKLLRAIETRRVRRVGATKETDVDVRIVCATNRRLATMVNEGTFREDLYYRLAVVEVALPALRDRKDDIPALAQRLFAKITGSERPIPALLLDSLTARAFPGNVRELRNAIERAITLGEAEPEAGSGAGSGSGSGASAAREPSALPQGIEAIVPLHLPLKDARDAWTSEFEEVYIRAMMRKTNGNLTRAAELAGVSRRFLQRTIARLGLRSSEPEQENELE